MNRSLSRLELFEPSTIAILFLVMDRLFYANYRPVWRKNEQITLTQFYGVSHTSFDNLELKSVVTLSNFRDNFSSSFNISNFAWLIQTQTETSQLQTLKLETSQPLVFSNFFSHYTYQTRTGA